MKNFTFSYANVRSTMALLVIFCLTLTSFAQNPYSFVFNGELVSLEANINSFEWDQMPETSKLADGYFGWIQFEETPDQQTQNYFADNDLRLLDYAGNGTYLFYMADTTPIAALAERKVRAISPIDGRFKMETAILINEIPDYAQKGDRIMVSLEYHGIVSKDYIIADLRAQQIEVTQVYDSANVMDLIIPQNCLETLSNSPYVRFVELVPAPPVKEDVQGKSIHRSNGLDTQMAGGWDYTGEGVGILVRDDGLIGPHIDFEGRIVNSPTGSSGSHGDGVAGIFTGAGNLNPRYRGMAAGADIYVVNYPGSGTVLDGPSTALINDGSIVIANSSYGDGCNAGYTFNARNADIQATDNPSFMHVFSCGNANGNNCGYGAGSQWGNITGGHKQGKNVIATANVFFDGSLVSSSSRGPADDGRIKPDITAHGQGHISTSANNGYQSFGGTSGAAPGIAGVSAQLYELYADTHGDVLPESGLVKAALLNTANDAGNVGPDFKYGWGIVNGLRAGRLLSEDRFLTDDISNGELNTTSVTVPAGTTQMRIMLYWTDPAGASGASVALVNDLDLIVKDPSDTSYSPWILDSTPDPSALDTPATTGADHLNNMEQVLINDPVAGSYTIEVSGFDVPFGPQNYFIVYEFIQENLTLVYPNYNETLVAGETSVIHWDAYNTSAGFDLEYSTDNGGSWTAITTVSASTTNYSWTVPSTVSGQAKVRITSGSFSDESDNNFSIAPIVDEDSIEITQVCSDFMTFVWDAVPGAESYDIYVLGAKYMEITTNTAGTSATIPIASPDDSNWVAVAPRNDTDGWTGLRSIAKTNVPTGLLNCDFANDIAVQSIDNTVGDFNIICDTDPVVISTTLINVSSNPQSGFDVIYTVDGETPVVEAFPGTIEPGNVAQFSFATPLTLSGSGTISLVVSVDLDIDENSDNDELSEDYFVQADATALNDFEEFELTGFPSEGWFIINPDDSRRWNAFAGIIGQNGAASRVGFMNNFFYTPNGETDSFVTEVYDLTGTDVPGLVFDLAKAQRAGGTGDQLQVDISLDCGTTWINIYDKNGFDLATVPGAVSSFWTPDDGADWREEELDLSAYIGEQVQFRFVNITGGGNGTFIDNIYVLNNYLGTDEQTLTGLTLYPNPTQGVFNIATNEVLGALDVQISNTLGQVVYTQRDLTMASRTASIDVSALRSGVYFVSLSADGLTTVKKLVIR